MNSVERPVFPKVAGLDQAEGSQAGGGRENEAAKTVIDYTIFHTVHVSANVRVTTGWNYASSESRTPEEQFCYVAVAAGQAEDRTFYIARTEGGRIMEQSTRHNFGQKVPDLSYEDALKQCRWFSG